VLVCVAPEIAQERRILLEAQARLAPIRGFELWTTTEVLMNERGLLAPIWLQGIPQRSQVTEQEGSHRQCLFDAMLGKRDQRQIMESSAVSMLLKDVPVSE